KVFGINPVDCTAVQTIGAAQETIICAASSFSWASFLTPAVIVLSVIVAAFGVLSARKSARQRATLDMIEKVESTEYYRSLHKVFLSRRISKSLAGLSVPKNDQDKKERLRVVDYLNHYELVSIGMLAKILDRDIYRKWMLGPFIRDWNAVAEFVQRERWKWDSKKNKWIYYDEIFANYQKVALMWNADAVNITEQTSGPPERPEGPGDETYSSGLQIKVRRGCKPPFFPFRPLTQAARGRNYVAPSGNSQA
ncbi:MAG: DUF4760 domain-containing protein, partial [Rhodospirillales bacterium]